MSLSAYMSRRRDAKVVRDEGGYRLDMGEANPVVFEDFLGDILDRFPQPVIFEPFAGHTGRSKSIDFAEDIGVKMIAYDLDPSDFRVEKRDSTNEGPDERIHGMLFHPPYYGTAAMTKNNSDLSNAVTKSEYDEMLSKSIGLAYNGMVMGGLVAAICRDYRYAGERVRLDHLMLSEFEKVGFKLIDVWLSEPDVILIMEK
jgi:hypothetical protein